MRTTITETRSTPSQSLELQSAEAVAGIKAGLTALADIDVRTLPDQRVRAELAELVIAANELRAQIKARMSASWA